MKFYRSRRGQQTVEMAPALLILFCFILVPMLDLLYMALAYCAGWYCNHLVVREIACRAPSDVAAAIASAEKAFKSSGLGNFLHVTNLSDTPSFQNGPTGVVATCTDVTIMTVRPMMPIPLFVQCPGLNEPVTFKFSAIRPQEEKGLK